MNVEAASKHQSKHEPGSPSPRLLLEQNQELFATCAHTANTTVNPVQTEKICSMDRMQHEQHPGSRSTQGHAPQEGGVCSKKGWHACVSAPTHTHARRARDAKKQDFAVSLLYIKKVSARPRTHRADLAELREHLSHIQHAKFQFPSPPFISASDRHFRKVSICAELGAAAASSVESASGINTARFTLLTYV